ncbi:hypothetical protein FRC07_000893 [Ceratobasidium sp. 392]|nr:hypothetical protein FRC07_000893 [Ceratobasidium sp. 392]
MPAASNNVVDLLVRQRVGNEMRLRAARRRLAAKRQALERLEALARLGLGSEFLEFLERCGLLDFSNGSSDTHESHDIPDRMHPPSSKGITRSQKFLRDLGVDPDDYPWLPKLQPQDTSMFPRSEPDKVYMNGKVYSQAYGQILFELPPENYHPTRAPDENVSEYGTSGQWAAGLDGHGNADDDGAASDYECTCGPCKRRAGY